MPLTEEQLKIGIIENNKRALKSRTHQLYWIYERLIPTSNAVTTILEFPRSAIEFMAEYIIIGFPSNVKLNNLYFTATSEKLGLKYVYNNLQDGINGAKVDLFTSPSSDTDPATGGDQNSYKGMMPLYIKFQGNEQTEITIRGAGLSGLAFVDLMITGHMKNRLPLGGGFYPS